MESNKCLTVGTQVNSGQTKYTVEKSSARAVSASHIKYRRQSNMVKLSKKHVSP